MKSLKQSKIAFLKFLLILCSTTPYAHAQMNRIKNLASVSGIRGNPLVGFGLVAGLQGTGDTNKSLTTNQAIANMLTRLGMKADSSSIAAGNIAAVIISADLPPFARAGEKFDIRISAVGDAKSLAGGTLLKSLLKGTDGKIYAIAQGGILGGQTTGTGNKIQTVAVIPTGATVERSYLPPVLKKKELVLKLDNPDFTTNARMVFKINDYFRGFFARSSDPASIEIIIPPFYKGKEVGFIADLENIEVEVDQVAMVVINERTGTVVMGSEVTVMPITISHGSLTIKVESADDDPAEESIVPIKGTTVGDLVESLNAMGAKPEDLVGILQALDSAKALQGVLKVM